MSYARSAVTRMTLDMSRLDLQRSETVTLGDTNRRWEVTLINGGAPFRLPPNWTAALTGIKPDGNGLLNGCSVVDGKIIYDFAAGKEIATCVGSYPIQFDIWDEVGELVASPKVYVNVLADGRPHAELKSEGQYTQIGNLIGRVNQTDEDVDLLAKNVLAQGTDITALKKKITTVGTITIPVSKWDALMPTKAYVSIQGGEALTLGGLLLVMPGDTATKDECERARVRIDIDLITDQQPPSVDQIVFIRAEERPAIPLNFKYFVLKTESQQGAVVALIGVDAYGEGGGTASGVDETAVRAIIAAMLGNVANERQYSAANPPPYPVTSVNGKTGAVSLSIPSKAADINAEGAGAVSTHNADQTAHPYLSGRVATALDRISGHDTNIEEINTSVAERLKTADLDAKLDAYKAAQGLVGKTTTALTNYYLKNEVYTKEEVAALISAIPKFEIKVVTSLPTSNISLTTVYLVKDTTEGGGLYTEYIYVNGAWEELGSQNLDLSGYVTDEELDNLLKSYAALTKVSELIADALKPYATDEEVAEAIRVATINFVTGSQVTTAINEALKSYYTSAQVDAQIAAQIKTTLAGYVPKEEGKGLSANDYTDADKAAVTKASSDSSAAVITANAAKQTADSVKRMADNGELDGAPGTPGAPGYTPIRGTDYWTAEDVADMDADNKEFIINELAKRNQQKIPVVNSVSEMTDTDLLYLMVKDGSLWYYAYTKVYKPAEPLFTNVLPTAIDTDGSIFNGIGYKDGWRTSESTGAYTEEAGCTVTGYIACKKGDIVYMRGISIHSGRSQAMPYNLSFERYGNPMYGSQWTKLENGDLSFTVTLGQTSGYINIVGKTPFADDAIISLNNPIEYTDPKEVLEWTAIQPLVYTDHTADIQALQNTVNEHDAKISKLLAGNSDAQSIRTWDKPVYDTAPVTLLGDDRAKPALTSADYSVEAVYAKYDALMAANPKYITTPIPFGQSAVNTTKAPNYAGHDLRCYEFREPAGVLEPGGVTHETKPKIIIMSGVHAEFAGVYGLYYALEEIATNPEFDDIKRNAHIMVIPCANPFVLSNQTVSGWTTSHVNANGVAIHNNFGVDHSSSGTAGAYNYGGAEAYSEPETVFIDNIIKANKDAVAFVSCHNFDYDTYYGTRVIWGSSATAYMCNLVTRLADKMTKAWLRDERYKNALPSAIESNWIGDASDVDYRLGYAQMSTSAGTEQKNALKYNIQAANLEIARIMKVFSGGTSCSSAVMTHGAEVYANWIRTILAAYQPIDKREYYFQT